MKRISQDTFDEVVKENMEDFDMELDEAIKDAIEQFTKQGIDLSNIDKSGGKDRKEILFLIKRVEILSKNLIDIPEDIYANYDELINNDEEDDEEIKKISDRFTRMKQTLLKNINNSDLFNQNNDNYLEKFYNLVFPNINSKQLSNSNNNLFHLFQNLKYYSNKNYELVDRNLFLILETFTIHRLEIILEKIYEEIKLNEESNENNKEEMILNSMIVISITNYLSVLCNTRDDVRDSFYGSKVLVNLLKIFFKIYEKTSEQIEKASFLYSIFSLVSLARVVSRTEGTKTTLIHNDIHSILIDLVVCLTESISQPENKSSIYYPLELVTYEKAFQLIRSLCIHDDIRSETSSAYENGKLFLKSSIFLKNVVKSINYFSIDYNNIKNFLILIKRIKKHEMLSNGSSKNNEENNEEYNEEENNNQENNDEKIIYDGNNNFSFLICAAGLQALRAMVTTNESVQILSMNGVTDMLIKFLKDQIKLSMETNSSSETSSSFTDMNVKLVSAIISLIRNISGDDNKKNYFLSKDVMNDLIFILSHPIKSIRNKIHKNYLLIEHIFGCLAQFTLRASHIGDKLLHYDENLLENSAENLKNLETSPLRWVLTLMFYYSTSDGLLRQGCLLVRNIAGRSNDIKKKWLLKLKIYNSKIFLNEDEQDYDPEEEDSYPSIYIEEVLRQAGRVPTVVSEAYAALRDLKVDVKMVKVREKDGAVVPAYEQFGQRTTAFRPIYDDIPTPPSNPNTMSSGFTRNTDLHDDDDDDLEGKTVMERIAAVATAPLVGQGVQHHREHEHSHSHDHGHEHEHDHSHDGGCCSHDSSNQASHDHSHHH